MEDKMKMHFQTADFFAHFLLKDRQRRSLKYEYEDE